MGSNERGSEDGGGGEEDEIRSRREEERQQVVVGCSTDSFSQGLPLIPYFRRANVSLWGCPSSSVPRCSARLPQRLSPHSSSLCLGPSHVGACVNVIRTLDPVCPSSRVASVTLLPPPVLFTCSLCLPSLVVNRAHLQFKWAHL